MVTAQVESATKAREADSGDGRSYALPFIHTHIPAPVVDGGFWAALVGATVLGAVEAPLALLVGAGVVIARHRQG